MVLKAAYANSVVWNYGNLQKLLWFID